MLREYFLWLLKLLTIVCLIFILPFFLISLLAGMKNQMDPQQQTAVAGRKVAVVEITGIIEDSKKVLKDLYRFVEDPSIDGIVLRVDSPGGAVGPSQEIYAAVKNLKEQKPIVVSMGSLAASGGLYVSLGASKILAQPGTLTGSIGVIMQAPNFTKIASTIGVDMVTIKSGKYKDAGNPFREMTPEDRDFLQATVDDLYVDFKDAVISGRGLPEGKVSSFADGRVIIGSQALTYGLIDGYGNIYDAARLVYEVKGKPLPANKIPELIFSDDRFEKFRKFFESLSSALPELNSSHLVRSPQAFYLMQ